MQRPQDLASCRAPVGFISVREALILRQQRDDRVETGIEPMDLIEMRLHHLTRRELPRVNQPCEFARAQEAQIVGRHFVESHVQEAVPYSGTAIGSSSTRKLVISASIICSPAVSGILRVKCTAGRKSVDTKPLAETMRPAMKTRCRPDANSSRISGDNTIAVAAAPVIGPGSVTPASVRARIAPIAETPTAEPRIRETCMDAVV